MSHNLAERMEKTYRVPFERLTINAFEEPLFNEQMLSNIVDPRIRIWFQKEFLLQNVAFFGIGVENGPIKKPQAPTMHRGAILDIAETVAPFIDEFGTCYRYIAEKGNGISIHGGVYWHIASRGKAGHPIGLFGYKDAVQEMSISNDFAEAGGRNGRVLAVVPFNHDVLKKWFQKHSSKTAYNFREAIGIVEENGDTAALCIRLLGGDRFDDLDATQSTTQGIFSIENMLIESAGLIFTEINQRGRNAFSERYQIEVSNRILDDTSLLTNGNLTETSVQALAYLSKGFHLWNTNVANYISQTKYEGKLRSDKAPKDVDIPGFWNDWETALPGTNYYHTRDRIMPYSDIPTKLLYAYDQIATR